MLETAALSLSTLTLSSSTCCCCKDRLSRHFSAVIFSTIVCLIVRAAAILFTTFDTDSNGPPLTIFSSKYAVDCIQIRETTLTCNTSPPFVLRLKPYSVYSRKTRSAHCRPFPFKRHTLIHCEYFLNNNKYYHNLFISCYIIVIHAV